MLVDYSSSGSSAEDSDTEECPRASKRIKPSLPSAAEIFKKAPALPLSIDNPVLHNGRIRSFAHERGNWASYCYFKLTTGRLVEGLRKAIVDLCLESGIAAKLENIDDVHLSLTKTFVLQHHWIESFTKSVQESLSQLKSRHLHLVNFDTIKVFENEDKTRTFLSLGVCEEDYSFLNEIVRGKLDSCLAEFKLPAFYEPADYHASFLWCLGSHGKDLKKISGKLNSILQDQISQLSDATTDELSLPCDTVYCKIGNKLSRISLME